MGAATDAPYQGKDAARTGATREIVLLTDHPWPSLDIEHSIIEGAGYALVAGPMEARPPADIERHIAQHDPAAILTCWGTVSKDAIAQTTDLRIVARLGVGLDNIAVPEATARGAWVTNVPDYCLNEVSDHAIALILAHYRGIVRLDTATKSGGWQTNGDGLERISDLTVGIIGYGRIGRATSRKLNAFGCRVIAFAPTYTEADGHAAVGDLAMIQSQADVIVLHVPLTPKTVGLIDQAFLGACRRRPLIVNVSRGGLIVNGALLAALEAGQIRGAALDVIEGEPTPPPELYSRSDVIATPHVAFASTASLVELRVRACEEVVRVLRGEPPRNPCNQPLPRSLPGGVSSDIRIAQGACGPEVVKKALAKLKVEAEWLSDPARSAVEVAAIHAFGELIGQQYVPQVLWTKVDENSFAMRLVDPRLRNWKRDLLDGRVDLKTARRAGELIGSAHRASQQRADLRRLFADRTYFHQLRVEPFFYKVATQVPALEGPIRSIVEVMETHQSALVHGDYSPKNILADGPEIVILDFEVAHWGDPRFDVGFCASHMILKSYRRGVRQGALLQAVREFLAGYAEQGPDIDDVDLVRITGCLIMARFKGSSPIDYAADIDQAPVLALATDMITRPKRSLPVHLAATPELPW